jgi:predicted phosphodiesterase
MSVQHLAVILLFISDTQIPMWVEKIWLKYQNNDAVTELIFSEISRDTTVAALFHLGDLTAAGTSDGDWKRVSAQVAPLRKKGIPFIATYGNHDYYWIAPEARRKIAAAMPGNPNGWSTRRFGNVAVLLLNSNFDALSDKLNQRQRSWYLFELRRLSLDSSVTFIIVGTHYSPYTNSTIVNPSLEVKNYIVPPFLSTKKCKLFISGHSHAFEHFTVEGKDFLVIGGGGGLLHPLQQDSEQRNIDVFPHQAGREEFHYLKFAAGKDSAVVSVMMLKDNHLDFEQVHRFSIPMD